MYSRSPSEPDVCKGRGTVRVVVDEHDPIFLQVSDKVNYAEAVELLGRIGPLMERLGREDEFASYVIDIREANARRPAFRSLLDAASPAPPNPKLRALD